MRYKLLGPRLRVSRALCREHADQFKNLRIIFLNHLMDDSLEFVQYLEAAGATFELVIGKRYSTNNDIYRRLDQKGITVSHVEEIERNGGFREIVRLGVQHAQEHNQQLIILEVGGYFAQAMTQLTPAERETLIGVVEDTTYGYNRYKALEKKLRCPVFHVARSQLKEYESYFVGEAVALALNNIMRAMGISLTGAHVLVLGYGMISSNATRAFRKHGLHPTVYDTDHVKSLRAYIEGFNVMVEKSRLDHFDLVFSATGQTALSVEEMYELKDGVVLLSGGSQQVEFDVAGLEAKAESVRSLTDEIKIYHLKQKSIVLLRDGTPINFRENSVPDEIMDLVFSEILMACVELRENQQTLAAVLHEVQYVTRSQIARQWLEYIK